MDYVQLEVDLQASSIKLLKADHAPLIISFLYRLFKDEQRVSIPLPEVIERLERYLEHLNERFPDRYPRAAQTYLKEWADGEHQFIHITVPTSVDRTEVELTAHTERTIGWLEELHAHHFVGTESRFLHMIELLRDMVQKSTEDPEVRLAQLEHDRDTLQRQIDALRQTAIVDDRLNTTQMKERFIAASMLARQLLRDFHLVEDTFREIASTLQKAQIQANASKGSLVAYMLNADEDLKSSDQGRSFYAFWRFLLAPSQQDEFSRLLETVQHLDEVQSLLDDGRVLHHLPLRLLEAGQRVVSSNFRMAEQLRRLLDEQMLAESLRVRELIAQIKQQALVLADHAPTEDSFLLLEGPPMVDLGMEHELWEPTETLSFEAQPTVVSHEEMGDIDLTRLYSHFSVEVGVLRDRVEALLETHVQMTLAEVLTHYPVEKGLSEIITYCVIATTDPRHEMHPEQTERVVFSMKSGSGDRLVTLNVPQILYRRYADAK